MAQPISPASSSTGNKKNKSGVPRQRSLRSRIMRVVAPMIMITFLIIGIGAASFFNQQAQNQVINSQQEQLDDLAQELNAYVAGVAEDVRMLANGRAAREFARDTLLSVSSASIGDSQARLLTDFSNTLEQRVGEYVAVRYITYTGSVWSEATNLDNTIPITNDSVQLNALRGDELLGESLAVPVGEVVLSDITFPGGLWSAARTLPYLRIASPVGAENDPSSIAGAIEMNVLATPLLNAIQLAASEIGVDQPMRHFIAVDREGRILLDSANVDLNVLQQAVSGGTSLATTNPDLALALEGVGRDPLVAQSVNGEIVSSQPITLPGEETPYLQLLILDPSAGGPTFLTTQGVIAILACLLIGAALSSAIYLFLGRLLQPMQTLSDAVASGSTLSAASTSADAPATDEIGQLSLAFTALAQQAEDLRAELNTQSRRYNRNLDITSRIGRETATLRDIDELLNRAINLISVEYGFYHAQVFLIDDVGKNAVLVYSTGEAGEQLLKRRHKIVVGSDSVVGIATATGQAVVVNDTEHPGEIPWRFNSLLPDTHAEMALPLQLGVQTIGALDVQSTRQNAFMEDDLQTFQLLADQIAIAVQNTRLLQQSQERVDQIDSLNRQLTRLAWEESGFQSISPEYRYDLLNVAGIKQTAEKPEGESEALPAMELPIVVRGEVIGTMAAQGESFTENEKLLMQAVTERVAIAIESARLFEETQNSLAETSTLYQLSRYLNEADNLEGVIQAIVMSVMPDATGGQILVFDSYRGDQPEVGEFAADWSLQDHGGPKEVSLLGLDLTLSNHPLLRDMQPNSVALVTDTTRDNRLDDMFRAVVQDVGAGAMALIPFSVRGVWRGIIIIEFPRPRQFSEREGRVYSALIDQAGVAIDNRMLLYENEMALAQIERLYTASRSINMSLSAQDLITAAASTAEDSNMTMALGVLEGEIDAHGWSTRLRLMAHHADGETVNTDEVFEIAVPAESPLHQREPQITFDHGGTQVDGGFVTIMRAKNQRFMAAFPLYSANQPIALFMLMSEEPKDLSSDDYEVYRALTGQMSTVLQNRRLLEQTATALDETRRLYTASRAITAAPNADQVFAAAAANLVTPTVPANRIAILLAAPTQTPDANYHEYRYLWTRDSDSDIRLGRRVGSDIVSFGEILAAHRDALLANDVHRDLAAYPSLLAVLERSGTNSALLLPVRTRSRWFGVLLIESTHSGAFEEAYLRFASAIADQMALALESQQLFTEAQDQAQRALALAEAGQFASRITGEDFGEIITEVFTKVADSADYTNWQLALVDDSGQRLMFVTQYLRGIGLMPPDQLHEQYMDVSADDPNPETYRLNRPLLINEPRSYPSYAKMTDDWFEFIGKRLYLPVRVGGQPVGVIAVGRDLNMADLDDSDIELASTLAAQIGVAVENRRLFTEAQSERQTLFTILETLPAGVLVLDPLTYKPIQVNQQAEQLLGRTIPLDEPFSPAAFRIYRTGTGAMYPREELPIYVAGQTGEQAVSDDVAILHEDGSETALLLNAAPIKDNAGNISAIVAAFEDISALRGLENSLQTTLRETITLYESTRAFAEADEMDDVLDQTIAQMTALEASDIQIVLLDEDYGGARVVRSLSGHTGTFQYPDDLLDAQQPCLIDQVATDPLLSEESRALFIGHGVYAAAALPLRSRSRREVPLGWLVLLFDTPQAFDERQQFLTTLTDTAAVALDNRNLFQSTETALQETAALYGATSAISRARTMEQIGMALQGALQSSQPDVYAVYLADGNDLIELFNEDLDGAPPPFADLLKRHNVLSGVSSLFVDDLRTHTELNPFERDIANIGNIRAFGMVQLRAKGQVNGLLLIGYHRPHRFLSGDVRFLNAVSDSASVVLDNVLLLDQIQNTLQETSILYQASRALSDAQSPQEILDAVIAHLQNRAFTQAFIAILAGTGWDAPNAVVTIDANWQENADEGVNLQDISLSAEQFPAWGLLATADTLIIDDVETAEIDTMEAAGLQSLDLGSAVIMPLRAGGRPIGAIVLGSSTAHEHTDRDLRIFRSFAEQASLRIDATRLLDQTERRARQLATSAEVSQIASSILDLNFLLPRLVDIIRDSFEYDHVQIFLMDADDRFAELRASTGDAGRQLLGIKHKLQKGSQSVIGQVTALGHPVIAADTADARVVHRPNPYLPNTRSEMGLPLVLKGQVVGALDVQSNLSNAFDDDDVAVLTTLAAQISVAIDNAQLFEQSSQRANEMSFLFTVTTAAAAAENVNTALENVAEELRASLDALSVSIYLPERFVDPDERTITLLRPVALAGSDQPLSELSEVQLTDERSLIAETARSARPIIIANIENERDYLPVAAGAQSAVIVPLAAAGDIIGLVTVESEITNAYNQDTLTLLLTLSGTLSAIVQNQQLLEQVQRTNDQLRELDRLKSDFLANMSHELRTPLNSIIGFSKVILKGIDGPLTEMQEQDLSTIYTSGMHLLNLINDILDQAKIAAGKMDLQVDYFDMKSVIDGVRSIGIGLVKDKPINIQVEVAPGLPKAFGDEFRTRQVLLNLVSNAAKFTREGTVMIRAYPVRDVETDQLMVRTDVIDTGIGIAEKDIPLLFEAFRQVDSSLTRTVGGTGLGLPIAKSLVEMQGGQMLVQSKMNIGSTFSIVMPTAPVVAEPPGEAPRKKGDTDKLFKRKTATTELPAVSLTDGDLETGDPYETGKFNSPRRDAVETGMLNPASLPPVMTLKRQILLIEDNPDMVDQFRRALQREGYEVYAASIVMEAEAMASGLHPTLIVLSASFGNGSGWDMLGRLKGREDTSDIPIIVVSLGDDEARAAEAGAFTFIRRPFTPETLVKAAQDAERDSRTERILIIDDQPDSVRILQDILDEQGRYRIFAAHSGMDGIALVARRRPDLVIVDLRMPEMDGFDVIRELRGNPETARIPILVVTGDSLTPKEQDTLMNYRVIAKTNLTAGQQRILIDEVRNGLQREAGD
jgi:GAF domain-containing protein/DNA-binding response OmpR family regulator